MLVRPALREYRTWTLDSRYWNGYVARPDDIIIATAPKCGTTWAQQIVSSLVFKDAEVRPIPPGLAALLEHGSGPTCDPRAAPD